MVGPAWAKWLAMAGMRIDAQRALMIGLVQEIFPEETFLDDVYAFCRKIMEIDPEVLGLAKLAVDISTDVQDRTVQRHVDRLMVTQTFDKFAKSMDRFKR
jgi:enoyl-CoA hydratase/carnithine racemase